MMKTSVVLLLGVIGAVVSGQESKEREKVELLYRNDYKYSRASGGWLKQHYWPKTWSEARLQCQLEGAVLASPINEGILTAMTRMNDNENNKHREIWTGIRSTFGRIFSSVEGVDLIQLNPSMWIDIADTDLDSSERCLMFNNQENNPLYRQQCSLRRTYMCFKKMKTNTTINECGTIDDGYTLQPTTGSCYKYHQTDRSWSVAYQTCTAEGGYLAVPNSLQEANILKAMIEDNTTAQYIAPEPEPQYHAPEPEPNYEEDEITKMMYRRFHERLIPPPPLPRGVIAFIGFTVNRDYAWTEKVTVHGESLSQAGYDVFGTSRKFPKIHYPAYLDDEINSGSSEVSRCGAIDDNGDLHYLRCDDNIPFICEKDPKSLQA